MNLSILGMILICLVVVGAWIAINPPTKWVNKMKIDEDEPKN
jgi:hypothetical protein